MKPDNPIVLQKQEDFRSGFYTLLLALLLFWQGLGVGNNMSDTLFWVNGTWTSISLEWLFIIVYGLTARRASALLNLWEQERFIVAVALLWLVCVFFSYGLSPYYSLQNPLAFMRLAETVTHFLFFLMVWDCIRTYRVNVRVLYAALVLSTLLVMIYFIYIHLAYADQHADQNVFSIRSESLWLNTHLHRIGYQTEAAIIILMALMVNQQERRFAIPIFFMLMIFLIWLGGRAALLGTFAAFLVYAVAYRRHYSLKWIGIFLIIIVAGLTAAHMMHVLDTSYVMNAWKKTFQSSSIDGILTGRLQVWNLVFEALDGHWWIGTGPQSYFFYSHRIPEVIHAHNFLVQFIGEWGIVGALLFLILMVRGAVYGLRLHQKDQGLVGVAAGVLIFALTVTALFSGIYFFYQTTIFIIFGYAIWLTPEHKQADR